MVVCRCTFPIKGARIVAETQGEQVILRVVMLSWEYPPMRVGGIAAALEGLAPALAKTGIEVSCGDCRLCGRRRR